MNMIKDIPELVKAEVISEETADKIRDFYRNIRGNQQIVFLLFLEYWLDLELS